MNYLDFVEIIEFSTNKRFLINSDHIVKIAEIIPSKAEITLSNGDKISTMAPTYDHLIDMLVKNIDED